ncbi:MAG TPA: sigma-70 family RNA polymerase sigma factor [Armatimonadota bacterium]
MDGIIAVFTRTKFIDAGPDAVAIARCKAGDTDAFAEIVERYQGMVAGVVSRALRDPEDAEDVRVEVFVRAFRSLGGFRADAKFSTWLYRIALNTALRHAGKAARDRSFRVEQDPEKPDFLSTLPADADEGPEALVWKRMSAVAVRKAVHDLPEKQRMVIVLHYFEEKTCEEIAEIIGVNVGTVWSRIHYAVKRLRGSLNEAGE